MTREKTEQFTRRCPFCDALATTKTHVIAKSFTSLFEADGHDALVRHDRTDPESGKTEVLKHARTFAWKPKAACEACNREWMGGLEHQVRPVIAGFARNTPMTLARVEQERLALWATIAAVVALEHEPADLQFASADFARATRLANEPPPGTQVYIGANTHGEMGWFGAHSLNVRQGSAAAWGAALSVGFANLHIVHHGVPDRMLVLRQDAHRALSRIWPSSTAVRWPPELSSDDRDLSPLARLIAAQSTFASISEAPR